jgi:hypothetical protein
MLPTSLATINRLSQFFEAEKAEDLVSIVIEYSKVACLGKILGNG